MKGLKSTSPVVYTQFLHSRIRLNQSTIHLLNSRTVRVFASCRTAVLRLVIFTSTLAQKFEI
jgi:hypothetical protein